MPRFGSRSLANLEECHPDLRRVFEEVVQHIDCSVIEGHRDEATQNHYFKTGKSKLQYPQSRHNQTPSLAADVVPYPIDWNDRERFMRFGHFVLGVASGLGVRLRWGGDWDRDWQFSDQSFHDLPHFELVEPSS